MGEQHADERSQRDGSGTSMKRRGILRTAGMAVGAVIAGIAAKQAAQPVAAAGVTGEYFETTSSDLTNPQYRFVTKPGHNAGQACFGALASAPIGFDTSGGVFTTGMIGIGGTYGVSGFSAGGEGVHGNSNSGEGVNGTGVTGVHGTSNAGGYGVLGSSSGSLPAVYGSNINNANSIGVQGYTKTSGIGVLGGSKDDLNAANGIGVRGLTDNGFGIEGKAGAGTGVRASSDTGYGIYTTVGGMYPAIYGESTIGGGNAVGVYGYTGSYGVGVRGSNSNGSGVEGLASAGTGVAGFATTGNGMHGGSTSGYGVYATSTNWHGLYAECGTNQGAGALVGVTNVASGVAFQARANAPATAAGFFVGDVSIFGSLGVSGGKFAVAKSKDGKYRAMHAVESPEAWFEDFGKAKLVSGKADVKLDPLFAQHVRTDDYHVFLTPYDPACKGLAVSVQRTDGFAVQELGGGTWSGTFSWRVVAKRADIKGERMPVWELPPGVDHPTAPPAAPTPPPPPAPPPHPVPTAAVSQGNNIQNPVQPAPPARP